MSAFKSTEELIKFAISMEKQMIHAYTEFSSRAETKNLSELFSKFSEEEKIHLVRLENILSSGQLKFCSDELAEINRLEYNIRRDCDSFTSCKDILKAVMDNAKMAFKLYSQIASLCKDQLLKLLFETLATDQSRHKLYFELELDKL